MAINDKIDQNKRKLIFSRIGWVRTEEKYVEDLVESG